METKAGDIILNVFNIDNSTISGGDYIENCPQWAIDTINEQQKCINRLLDMVAKLMQVNDIKTTKRVTNGKRKNT